MKKKVALGLVALVGIAYGIMPFDFIPDLFPVVGFVDDIAILISAVTPIIATFAKEQERKKIALEEKNELEIK